VEITITGATGFVGQALMRALQAYHTVLPLRVRYQAGQRLQLDTPCVIHLAGKAHDLKQADASAYEQANFELTKQLYDAFLESPVTKIFIFMSTVKAAADSVEGVLTEDFVANPQTAYGLSKRRAELYLQNQSLPAGKKYYILRPCVVHGAGNKGNLNLLLSFIRWGLPYPLAAYHNQRSFLSLDNLCFIVQELIVRLDIPIGVYHCADDEALSTNELVKRLATAQGKTVAFWPIPKLLIQCLAKLGDGLGLPLTTERLSKLTENYVVSNAKIKQALDKPLPYSSEAGWAKTAQSFL
jgi:nucleoside-diphosphate-sugar epimerase